MNQFETEIIQQDTIRSLEQDNQDIRTILRGITNKDNHEDIIRLLEKLKFYDRYIAELEMTITELQFRLKDQNELEMNSLLLANKLASLTLRHYV